MRLSHAGTSDVGRKRTHNEDAYLLLPEENLFCVADGMGGHASGEVAARIAVEEMAEFFRTTGRDEDATWPFKMDPAHGYDENRLLTGVKLANLRIFERAATDQRLRGMGTTIVTVSFPRSGDAVLVGHVGDSRAYLLRGGKLEPLTRDHSMLEQMIELGWITRAEASWRGNGGPSRYAGMSAAAEADVHLLELQPGDRLLLCSDGLTEMLDDDELPPLLAAPRTPEEACARLVAAANDAGGRDNITVIVVAVS